MLPVAASRPPGHETLALRKSKTRQRGSYIVLETVSRAIELNGIPFAVLVYFEKPVQEAAIERLIGHIRPGGYLLLGHSEAMIESDRQLERVAPAVCCRD